MSARAIDPHRLDVETFAKDAAELAGRWPLRLFARLGDVIHKECPPGETDEVVWSARGELRSMRGASPQAWMHLKATASLRLECQRCLGPVEVVLDVDRRLLFVPGEDAAAQIDADSEDDVLAMTRALDVRELVEDELLLALPLVPRHDVCPSPLQAGNEKDVDSEDKPNPFAALAALRHGKLSS